MTIQTSFDIFAPQIASAQVNMPSDESERCPHCLTPKPKNGHGCYFIEGVDMCTAQFFSLNHTLYWVQELAKETREHCCPEDGLLHGTRVPRPTDVQILEHFTHTFNASLPLWGDEVNRFASKVARVAHRAGIDRSVLFANFHNTVHGSFISNDFGFGCACGWEPTHEIRELPQHLIAHRK